MTEEKQQGNEGPRLGLDFGEGSVVISASGVGGDCSSLAFPGISREVPVPAGSQPVHLVPALVEYRDGKAERRGYEVLIAGTTAEPATARWIRHSLCHRNSVKVPAGNGHSIRYEEAAGDLLAPLLTRALERYPESSLTIAIPPEAPPEYGEVLLRAARNAGVRSCSTISEYDAALAGYGCQVIRGSLVLFVTFSESDLAASIIACDEPAGISEDRLRVLARATGPMNCRMIDTAIVHDLLEKIRLPEGDRRAARLMPWLYSEAAHLRETLPLTSDPAEVRLVDSVSGKTFSCRYTAADIGRVLAACEVVPCLRECISRAISALRMRGGEEGGIVTVLLLGGGCSLPVVKDEVKARFPGAAVHADHPLDAVSRGAAGYIAPPEAQDRIRHSYALRYWDPTAREHHFRFLVQSGTRYPSPGQVARVIISAAYDGQILLGIPLYEIGGDIGGGSARLELVSDAGGGMRLAGPVQDADTSKEAWHANERSPTLLVAAPPARKGEPRFECTFTIDLERNLCLSARDLVTGTLVKLNAPVYRLT